MYEQYKIANMNLYEIFFSMHIVQYECISYIMNAFRIVQIAKKNFHIIRMKRYLKYSYSMSCLYDDDIVQYKLNKIFLSLFGWKETPNFHTMWVVCTIKISYSTISSNFLRDHLDKLERIYFILCESSLWKIISYSTICT